MCLSPGVLAIPPSTPAERASSFKTAGLTSESKFESQTTLSKKSGGGSSGGRSGGSGGSGALVHTLNPNPNEAHRLACNRSLGWLNVERLGSGSAKGRVFYNCLSGHLSARTGFIACTETGTLASCDPVVRAHAVVAFHVRGDCCQIE